MVAGPRIRVDVRDGLLSLSITNAVPEDAGVYRILVRNQASEITSQCSLNVYETIKTTASAPIFTNSIKGRNFSKAHFNCLIYFVCSFILR